MCPGCYKPNTNGYCAVCRKELFDGKKVSHILSFEKPQDNNHSTYSQKTKGLSISGVQLKYSLKLEDNSLILTDVGGEYILKPIPPSAELKMSDQAPENEHLTMQIARKYGIETAANALIYFSDGTPAYITRRFDIKPTGGKYQQEDFAQLLGKTKVREGENFKYNGSYEDIGKAMQKFVPAYPSQVERLFEVILFNFVFSNGDAHLKNFSLIETPGMGDYILTKSYDLMNTRLHIEVETDTALELYEGDTNDEFYALQGEYGQYHFRELARRLGIQEKRANRIIFKFFQKQDAIDKMIDHSFLNEHSKIRYKQSYHEKIKRLGLNKDLIADKLGIKNKTAFPPKTAVRFIGNRGDVFEGIITGVLEDNKFAFLQSHPANNNPETIIDGDLMTDVSYLK